MTELDLTPLAPEPDVSPAARRRVGKGVAVAVVLIAAIGFVAWRGLGNATLYFRTADEAVAQKAELGTRRFRMEGTVLGGTVKADLADGTTRFSVASKGVRVRVVHEGDPPELFQPGIPVVVEGRWQGAHFASDRILVRHTNEYKAKNPERLTTTTT